jgi:hypothetical protein
MTGNVCRENHKSTKPGYVNEPGGKAQKGSETQIMGEGSSVSGMTKHGCKITVIRHKPPSEYADVHHAISECEPVSLHKYFLQ